MAKSNIVLFSTADWDNPFWTNKQHTAKQLAERGYKVLYVESLGLRQPSAKASDISRIIKRIFKFLRGPKKVEPNLYVFSPLAIPLHRFAVVRYLNHLLLTTTLKLIQWVFGFSNPWVWTYNPMVLKLAQSLRPSKVIYHSVDDLSAAPGIDKLAILQNEEELLRECDAVFCTSRRIEEHCKKIAGSKVHYFSNVVDYGHFHKAPEESTEPADLANIPKPRIGFVGAISEYKFDFDAVFQAASATPEVHWVLIGKVGEGQPNFSLAAWNRLVALKNVHAIGPKDYQELPRYLAGFNACVIPCPVNDYTQAMFPMKFFEYLAAGRPVISRRIDSLKEYESYFYGYDDSIPLSEAARYALQNGPKPTLESALSLAQDHTWEKRLDKMLEVVLKP